MAPYKTLLKSVQVVNAGKKRKCFHNKSHLIKKGDIVLEVNEGHYVKGYCCDCGLQMLRIAKSNLVSFEKQIL